MPVYTYETIPADATPPRRFDVRQLMSDPPLAADPETGLPVRRVIVGGNAVLTAARTSAAEAPAVPAGGCGSGCACG